MASKRRSHDELERLERRDMLAGDLAAGDSNGDFYFDDSDFVTSFQFGKFETGESAGWPEGDWNGDSEFNSSDFVIAFQEGLYRIGAYDPDAADSPTDKLSPISTSGAADTTVYYEPSSGGLAVGSTLGDLTTIQLASSSDSFLEGTVPGLFDVRVSDRLFWLHPSGKGVLRFQEALPSGLTESEVLSDLSIDGSVAGGGDLGHVRLELVATLPEGYDVERVTNPNPNPNPTPRPDGPKPEPHVDGLVAGDSNGDIYFDEADFIQTMKSGKYETDASATWEEGDWNGDGKYNSGDYVAAFVAGWYARGAYNDTAGDPVNELAPFSTAGPADVTVYYDSTTGTLTTVATDGDARMTTLHFSSLSGQFHADRGFDGLFDISRTTSQFQLEPSGENVLYVSGALPTGLSLDSLRSDLLVDGSIFGGGGLGTVLLDDASNIPAGIPAAPGPRPINPNPNPVENPTPKPNREFVDISVANSLLTYDPANGDITITGIDAEITTLELISQSGVFVGTETTTYLNGLFDVSVLNKVFVLKPAGFDSLSLPGIAKTGLSADEFFNDVTADGAMLGGGRIQLAMNASLPETVMSGDVNADFFFDETDILQMMKSGKFGSEVNAHQLEGDWNGDFRFDESDLELLANGELYGAGAYSENAGDAQNSRIPIGDGELGDVVFHYDQATGDVTVEMSSEEITALHVTSESQSFGVVEIFGEFDTSTDASFFIVDATGMQTVSIPGLLPPGMGVSELRNDLRVDAALKSGGGITRTALTHTPAVIEFAAGDANEDFRVDAADLIQIMRNGWFQGDIGATWNDGDFDADGDVDADDLAKISEAGNFDANGTPYRVTGIDPLHSRQELVATDQPVRLMYLPFTGSIVIDSPFELSSLHVTSNAGEFQPSGQVEGPFDADSSESFFAFDPHGIPVDEVLLRLPVDLTRAQILRDLRIDGTRMDGQPFGAVSLVMLVPAKVELHCEEFVASGFTIGDVNLDGRFDSQDIVLVFQAAEYEDNKENNSTWYEGDWNCDGEFNSADLIAAFRNGGFTFEARPKRAAAAIHYLTEMEAIEVMGDDDDLHPNEHLVQGDIRPLAARGVANIRARVDGFDSETRDDDDGKLLQKPSFPKALTQHKRAAIV